jgi:hypothetical protein
MRTKKERKMKKVWLICNGCGYNVEILENEFFDRGECAICGEKMVLDLNRGKKLEEEPLGDNFPQIPDREREMRDSIGTIGVGHTWEIIESIKDVRIRLQYREAFFRCGGTIPEREI